jgi:myxalamid-type polyketide synthase MxaE and MxaD
LSGTNAHVVLEEAPARPRENADKQQPGTFLLPLSARSPAALRALAGAFHDRLGDADLSIGDICYTACVRRTHHEERLAVIGESADDLRSGLKEYLARDESSQSNTSRRKKLAFVFSGHGGQYPGMGRQLLQQEPVFRRALETCDRAMRSYVDWSLVGRLATEDGAWLQKVDYIQPAIFAVRALVELRSWEFGLTQSLDTAAKWRPRMQPER